MVAFIDEFYHSILTSKFFNSYKAGTKSRKQRGYDGLVDEADDLFMRTVNFSQRPLDAPDWDRRELEIEILKNLTFKQAKQWFCAVFNPNSTNALKGLINPESYELYKKFISDPDPSLEAENLRLRLNYESFAHLAKQLKIKLEDSDEAKDQCKSMMTLDVILAFLEKIGDNQKNFLAVRIFSHANKDQIVDTRLDEKCKAGIETLASNTYTTYLPKLNPDKNVQAKDLPSRRKSFVAPNKVTPFGQLPPLKGAQGKKTSCCVLF